ncbi:septum site-determining protein MinC [Oleiagrimonas soli]|uniref:Probable septum site-determining protein MinC n=1 Tax=Oleiagrimonas soli TaxID=1543381 RepID=A0A099CV50_9GAMM|nr:septum site-determining protein MinC [Oleiagrimonas soli]KGI77838.1 septum formation inhibitor [Oleiagrimonas soli]MBB6183820.1 septum site-determining protein MinC [Oleiagrimonas soli]
MNAVNPSLEAACDLRFGQVGIACVRVRQADAAAICGELERRVQAAPQLFQRTAVVLDLSHLSELPDDGMVDAMLEAIRTAGMLPVGLAYGTKETEALAERMHLPLIAKFRSAYERGDGTVTAAAPVAATPAAASAAQATVHSGDGAPAPRGQYHDGQVRSGQQVYARERDLVVNGVVANAAEVIADGSIHVYGTLRGRALAGAQGDEDARIFCSDFRAELVSIAGQYRVFEQLPDDIAGKAVQCRLDGDKLLIEPL